MKQMISIDYEILGNVVVIRPPTDIDTVCSVSFQETLRSLANKGYNVFVIDLTNVNNITSSGFGIISAMTEKLVSRQGSLSLCGVKQGILSIIKSIDLDKDIAIYQTLEEALEKH